MIAYGEMHGVKEGDVWTQEQADSRLCVRVGQFLVAVLKRCPRLHLEPPERWIGGVNFAYNIGVGAFGASSVCRKTMRGEFAAAAEAFLQWNKVGGRVLNGLTLQRKCDRLTYLKQLMFLRHNSCMKNGAKPHTYQSARRCIYCDEAAEGEGLREEHIIPEGLGGNLKLPEASCRKCEGITSKFELKVQRDFLGIFREKLNLRKKSHRKRARVPQFVELSVVGDPDVVIKRIPAVDMPGILHMPLFRMPCVLNNTVPTGELSVQTVMRPTYYGALHDFANRISGWNAQIGKYDPLHFARMLAKIGHSFAVAELGYANFRRLFLERLIRGIEPFYADNCVGSLGDDIRGALDTIAIESDLRHEISLSRHKQPNGFEAVIVKIRLFANYGAPEYLVVVGEITPQDAPTTN